LEDSAWFGYQQNEERQQHCDFDRAFFYEKLLARGELATVIARKAKISNALLSYYRSYAKLPIEILELVRTNPLKFGANSAYQLLKLNTCCGLRTALAVAIKYSEEDQTYRWLVNQVQAHATPLSSTAVVPSKQIKYVNGSYKQKGSLFEVSINVPIDQKADFALALERLLDTVAIKEDASRSADV
jgi:ParB family chromosome partitioning protein